MKNIFLFVTILLLIHVKAYTQVTYTLDAQSDCMLLPDSTIIGGLTPGADYKVSVTANNVQAPMQGLFFMYIDDSDGHSHFRYVNDGESFTFKPYPQTRQIAPIYVDWANKNDNSGTITVNITGPTDTVVNIDARKDCILLDDSKILGGLSSSIDQTVFVHTENVQAPMQGLFFMYIDSDSKSHFRYVNDGEAFTFKPYPQTRQIAPIYVDWADKNDNSGKIYMGITNRNNITAIKNNKSNLPAKYLLFQNYPNPFNPSTTIQYTIPKESFITIKVYDVLGRHIVTLVNEKKPVGIYSVNFSTSNLSSGIYFYQMRAGNYTQTKKMIVLK